jgi:hypothetical protein
MATLTLRLVKGSTLTFSETDGNFTSLNNEKIERDGSIPFTGAQPFVAGTVSAPGITIAGDTNTGVYSPAADQLAITCGGTQRGLFSSSGLTVTGTISGTHSGDGSAITNLNASNIATGTLADARLSSNVPLKNAANTFTANQTLSVGAISIFTINSSGSPELRFENTGAAANNKNWVFFTNTTELHIRPYSDDYLSSTSAISIARSGAIAGAIQTYGNLFVGFNHSGVGYIGISTGDATASGFTAFFSPSGTRVGYIGFATTFGTGDNGTIPYVAGAHSFTGRANTVPVSVAFSATPTFNSAQSNIILFGTMTANVTSMTISNPVDGAQLQIRFVQDGTGGRTVTLPSNVQVSGSLNTAANAVTWLVLTYVSSASRWEGTWTKVS